MMIHTNKKTFMFILWRVTLVLENKIFIVAILIKSLYRVVAILIVAKMDKSIIKCKSTVYS